VTAALRPQVTKRLEADVMSKLTQDEMVAILQAYQDRLTEAEKQGPRAYNEAFAQPPPGVAIHEFDGDGVIRRINAEESRLLGFAADGIVGHPVWEFVVMQDASRQSVQKKLSGEKDIKPFVRTFRRADGSGVPMLIVDRRLHDAQGVPRGIRTAMMSLENVETA
jgi:PAS domain S-box-containing protein